MSNRIERINEQLIGELAKIVNESIYLEDGLITLTKVRCSADLKNARVNISVLPENKSGSALKLLRRQSGQFTKTLRNKLNIKLIPKFHFAIDNQERYAADLEKVFQEINS